MGNRPQRGYDYRRAGVAMVTLTTRPGKRLCRITQETFTLTETGRLVQQELLGIPQQVEQVKIGQYQIMPDHLHALLHVVRDMPGGMTLQRLVRGFKLGVNRRCRERLGEAASAVFEKGMHHTLVLDRAHLEREVAYIRDNVRRYRLRLAHPDLFRAARKVMTLPDGTDLWGIGNAFLLNHPRRVQVQFSRRATEADWEQARGELEYYLEQGYVLVSPFISPHEQRALHAVIAAGGRAIHLTHRFFGERYKPMGKLFDLCCAGRLLEVSVAGAFARYARLDRAACLKLNEAAAFIATTQWSQWGE